MEANEEKQKILAFFFFGKNFLHLPREGLSFPLIAEHHLKSLAILFFHLWKVGWVSLESTVGSWVMESLYGFALSL